MIYAVTAQFLLQLWYYLPFGRNAVICAMIAGLVLRSQTRVVRHSLSRDSYIAIIQGRSVIQLYMIIVRMRTPNAEQEIRR